MTQVVVVYHIAILKEHEAGMKTADLCGSTGSARATFYNWKAK